MSDQGATWIIDAGNTRLKLRQIDGEQVLRSIVLLWSQVTPCFIKSISGDRVIVTKVVSFDSLTLLLSQFNKVIHVDHHLISAHFKVNTLYKDPNQLGVDRLLAACGARLLFDDENIAVINAGTATTVELIKQLTHQGGMIIAGNQLMLNALSQAEQLPDLNVNTGDKIGTDSYSSMQTGLAFMNQGLVLNIVKEYKVTNLVVCGGNAVQFANFTNIDASIHIIPDLIMNTLTKLSTRLL